MSVYRDTNSDIVFEHSMGEPLYAMVFREAVLVQETDTAITPVNGKYTLTLSYKTTQLDGQLRVVWTNLDDFERVQNVDVVTPLISLGKLRTLFDGENKSDAELAELENTVRVFIQAYVGQSFGFFQGTRQFIGNGGNRIALDMRLNTIIAFSGGWPGYLAPGPDRWSLQIIPDNLLSVKQAPPEDLFDTYVMGGVIRVPSAYIKRFNQGTVYSVTGTWGWDFVPDEVQEAAMLLANDFSCSEVTYRDRYLESIKIQQDTITYHPGAFRGTGNARADLLLAKFRRTGMAII
jgi:hypothetical protein